jgi:uncharacterized protein YcfL
MKHLVLVLPLAAALLITGCTSTRDKGPYAPVSVKNKLEDTERFVLLDKATQDSVTCTGLQEGRQTDGRLAVSANIRNRENRRIQVQANCVFKDAQGFTVEETPWQSVILDENAQQGFSFVSMNDKAARYTIRVRQYR